MAATTRTISFSSLRLAFECLGSVSTRSTRWCENRRIGVSPFRARWNASIARVIAARDAAEARDAALA
jgi:hypothetical protein